jgi:peptidoglycan/xylan/chitin deacetylase (PgdA/CDA1 family)
MRAAPTIVLMYHRVAAPARDTHRLCVGPDRFADHVDHLVHRLDVVPLLDARRRSSRPRAVITFDDGYADNAQAARPILEAAGAPATFFVTSGLVGDAGGIWSDQLERLLFDGAPRARHLQLVVAGRPLTADIGSAEGRSRAHDAIYRRVRGTPRACIDEVLEQLRDQLDVASPVADAQRFMSADEVRDVAGSDLIDIGGHGATHQQLSALGEDEQRAEIVAGRAALRALTNRPVATFAYPFGGPEAFDEVSVRLVEEAGYDLACAGWPGVVRPRSDRFRLPRFVVRDWDRDTFAEKIEQFLAWP